MDNNRTIGAALIEMRESLNIIPSELARIFDVSPSYIYQVEGNVQMPSTEYLDALIKVYVRRSHEEPAEKIRRVEELINMTKNTYIEKNQSKIQRKAERRYDVLYNLVSEY